MPRGGRIAARGRLSVSPMLKVKAKVKTAPALKRLAAIERQIPFAASVALNSSAFDVRKEYWRAFSRGFKLRNRFHTKGIRKGAKGPGGVGVETSTKRTLKARIFTGEGIEHTELHARGGRRVAGAHRIGVAANQQTKQGKAGTPKRTSKGIVKGGTRGTSRVRSLLNKWEKGRRPYFVRGATIYKADLKKVRGKRKGISAKGRRASRRVWSRRVFVAFQLTKSARIRRRLGRTFDKATMMRLFDQAMEKHLPKAVELALRSAKL